MKARYLITTSELSVACFLRHYDDGTLTWSSDPDHAKRFSDRESAAAFASGWLADGCWQVEALH